MGSTVTYATDLSALSDRDLTDATNRAWREAARCWQEARSVSRMSPIRAMLITSAEAAEEWHAVLRDEQSLRDHVTEVRSDDVYEVQPDIFGLADGGTTTIPPTSPKVPKVATSPWVTRADRSALPSRIEGGIEQPKAVR